jgi:outer membrane protein
MNVANVRLARAAIRPKATGIALVAGAMLLAAIAPASAQPTLTLDRAVDAALAGNAALRAVRAGAGEARIRGNEARASLFPRVSYTELWQRSNEPVFVFSSLLSSRRFTMADFGLDALNRPAPIGFFRSTLELSHVFFDGGRRRSALSAARTRGEVADLAATTAAAELILETTRAFGRVVAADAARTAARAGLAAVKEDLERAGHRRAAGTATDADVLEIAVHAADLEQRAIRAGGDRAIAAAELNRLMGAPVANAFHVVEPVAGPPADERALTELLAEAEAARPELRQAAAREQLAAAVRREARGSLLPQLSGQAAVDLGGTRADDRAPGWLVGGVLSWQLSLGGAEVSSLRAATQTVARAVAEREDVRARIHVEVVSAIQALATARARLAAGRAAVRQARESQRIIRDRFDAGFAAVHDVLRASAAVLDATAMQTTALVDVIVGEALVGRALGRIVE